MATEDDPDFPRQAARILKRFHAEGCRRWGNLALGLEVYQEHFLALARRRLARGGSWSSDDLIRVIDRAAGVDVFLAVACEANVSGAWEVFINEFGPRLRGLARRHRLADAEADELVRGLPGELVAKPGRSDARTRLGTFDGTGTLFDWLAVILLRRVADRRSRPRAAELTSDDGSTNPDTGRARTHAGEPIDALLDQEACQQVSSAFDEAWQRLEQEERLAILYKFREGLAQCHIGRLLGAGEWRVTRILQRALGKIRTAIERCASLSGQLASEHLWVALRDSMQEHLQERAASTDILPRKPPSHEQSTEA